MKVNEVMTNQVRVVGPDHRIREAARLMDELNVGVLSVCDGERLLGIITDRDITVRATAVGKDPDKVRVREIMTEDVRWCFEDEAVEDVAQMMGDVQIRRIPVVDRNKRLVGIVALGDLATDRARGADEALRRISEPSEPDRTGAR